MKDLGERIYKKDFSTKVVHKNDGNGHLNNAYYSLYSEEIRGRFLKSLDWSDETFNEDLKISMRVGKREIRYRLSLEEGDEARINLQIYFRGNRFFHMIYTFYTPSGGEAAIDKTTVGFVNTKTKEAIDVPNFFLEKIREES